ncbi:putative nuclease HARBI1 [Chionoecetes opilio]|uniref:Putative nuclease HARBI1 n=1 Tax=Chionoecetes opilio TaxID=41210 RepID=A0A8J4YT84_CHIOP|nr:putative nuclease HARBI1 [Chionoecetes opilio]
MAEAGRADRVRRRGRIFRARRDVLAEYSDRQLLERYRFDRAGIEFITDLVKDRIQSGTRRNHAISALLKVVVTLRYLATGRMQLCGGDDLGMSQSTVSRVITQTIEALATPDIVRQFIDFPTTREAVDRNMQEFQRMHGFPTVVGAIDGTHVRIIAPAQNEEIYVNRHRYHSINVQVVCDAKYRLIDVVTQ